MMNVLPFFLLIIFIGFQRIIELFVAKRNEKWMKQQGAVEFGQTHYKFMVLLHVLFFVVLITENVLLNPGISSAWPIFLGVFGVAQCIRIWAIASLGRYWNTKILVLANSGVIKSGPYRFLKHPNYLVVALELSTVPLMFNSFYTAIIFTILNMIMLMIRIPMEEKALKTLTKYDEAFRDFNRFIPKFIK